jgi:DNA-binding CsgD family transcriptional regulator
MTAVKRDWLFVSRKKKYQKVAEDIRSADLHERNVEMHSRWRNGDSYAAIARHFGMDKQHVAFTIKQIERQREIAQLRGRDDIRK